MGIIYKLKRRALDYYFNLWRNATLKRAEGLPLLSYPLSVFMTFELQEIYEKNGLIAALKATDEWIDNFDPFKPKPKTISEEEIKEGWKPDEVKYSTFGGYYIPPHRNAFIKEDKELGTVRKFTENGEEVQEFEL